MKDILHLLLASTRDIFWLRTLMSSLRLEGSGLILVIHLTGSPDTSLLKLLLYDIIEIN